MKPYHGPATPPDEAAAFLRLYYSKHPLAWCAAGLGVPAWKAEKWAWKLGLKRGRECPSGFEFISHAAVRAGFSRRTLKMILKWAGVALHEGPRQGDQIVSPKRVDRAVKLWLQTETVTAAAVRHGVSPRALRTQLEAERRLPRKALWGTVVRVRSDVIDGVVQRMGGKQS